MVCSIGMYLLVRFAIWLLYQLVHGKMVCSIGHVFWLLSSPTARYRWVFCFTSTDVLPADYFKRQDIVSWKICVIGTYLLRSDYCTGQCVARRSVSMVHTCSACWSLQQLMPGWMVCFIGTYVLLFDLYTSWYVHGWSVLLTHTFLFAITVEGGPRK
jgi:hypothetical protein